ncbi:MAG: dockerin type I repeat-containing protein [Clostridia bacterium]|nr:dockerin type I repeat-containing protein [Clostridia bacterium]
MKLRSLIVILAVIAVVCLFPALAFAEETPAEPAAQEETAEIAPSDSVCHVRGDVDRDGKITASDARAVLRLAVELDESDDYTAVAADYDMNGNLSAGDARFVLRVAVGLDPKPGHISTGRETITEATCMTIGTAGKHCAVCGCYYDVGTLPRVDHKSGGWILIVQATCSSEGYMVQECVYCGEEISSRTVPMLEHAYDADHPVFTEDNPDCTKLQYVDYVCMNCGAKKHTLRSPSKYHDYIWIEALAPTCTTQGLLEQRCKRCDKASGELQAEPSLGGHSPVWVTETEPNENLPGHRIYRCTKCREVIEEEDILYKPGPHRFDMQHPVFLDENPDCTELQEVEYTCLDCGEKRVSLRLPSASHNYTWFVIDEPTCTKTGEQEERCARCEQLSGKPNETLEKLPHESAGWTLVAEATCSSEGLQEEYCAVCGELIGTKRLPKTAHAYDREHPRFVDEEPDCTKRQKVEYACLNCGATVLEDWEPLDDHQFDWVAHIEPTCTEEGRAHRECLVCGKMSASNLTRVLPPLGHDPDWEHMRFLDENPDCTVAQKVECVCLRCGETVEVDWEPKEAHDWKWIVEIEPTCTVDGKEYEACAVCGKRKNENVSRVINALGHDPYWATLYQPTETEPGLEIYLCRRCGDVLDQREIPALTP